MLCYAPDTIYYQFSQNLATPCLMRQATLESDPQFTFKTVLTDSRPPEYFYTQKKCWLSHMAFFVFVVGIRLPPQAALLPSFPLKKSKIPLLVKISTIK